MIGRKEDVFKLRLTEAEKENLRQYAKNKGVTMSTAIRQLCEQIFNGGKNDADLRKPEDNNN